MQGARDNNHVVFAPAGHTANTILDDRRRRIVLLVESWRGGRVSPVGQHHLKLKVTGITFADLVDNRAEGGRMVLHCKAAHGRNGILVQAAPDRFFIPKRVGTRGWIGLFLDRQQLDWAEVEQLLLDAYYLAYPWRRAQQSRANGIASQSK